MSVKYLLLIYSLRALNPFSKEAKTTKVIVKTSFFHLCRFHQPFLSWHFKMCLKTCRCKLRVEVTNYIHTDFQSQGHLQCISFQGGWKTPGATFEIAALISFNSARHQISILKEDLGITMKGKNQRNQIHFTQAKWCNRLFVNRTIVFPTNHSITPLRSGAMAMVGNVGKM